MLITKRELINLNACPDGLERFIEQTNNRDDPEKVVSLIGGKNTYSDFLWLAGKKLSKEKIVKFACNCALINVALIKPYTSKYKLIINFLKNPMTEKAVARAVARAAVDVAVKAASHTVVDAVAYAVVDASHAVGTHATTHTATCASHAVFHATCATDDAVNAIKNADNKTAEKIDDLLIQLFKEDE